MHCRLTIQRAPTGMNVILDGQTFQSLDDFVENSSDSLTSPCDRKVDIVPVLK